MHAPGPRIASGRDCDVFEYGPGLVLRRSREGRSQAREAETMRHVAALGFPVPAVEEVSPDGTDLVMARVEGSDLVRLLERHPWRARRYGALLGGLHRRLHEIPAPPALPAAPVGDGDRLVHLDLHPLNVMIGPDGPVVIDWSNAGRGDPAVDVALAWVLMAAGSVPTGRVVAAVVGPVRRALVRGFLDAVDVPAARAVLRPAVEWKLLDPHMSAAERRAMQELAEREGTP